MNSNSANKDHNISTDYRHHGQRAAKYVIDAEGSYTKIETGPIAGKEIIHDYEADHSLDHLLPQASIISRVDNTEGRDAAQALLKEYPELNSRFQAGAVVSKAAKGPYVEGSFSVVTFGQLAFAAYPYEPFDCNGKEVREGTVGNPNYAEEDQLENPFDMTIVCSLANGSRGYLPSAEGYKNGGYERDTTPYAAGTGEIMVTEFLQLLNELHAG
jgi:hypothetical protein